MTPAAIFLDSGIQSDTLLPPKVFDERLLHFQRRVSAWGQARPKSTLFDGNFPTAAGL